MIINDSQLDYTDENSLKYFCYSTGLIDIYCCYKRYLYHYNRHFSHGVEIPLEVLPYAEFVYFAKKFPILWEVCRKIYNARRSKCYRIRKRLYFMLKYSNCKNFLFLTFTFTDSVFESTNDKTRRVYVRRFLTATGGSYVANLDFGKLNEREHYHAIVGVDRVDFHNWHYGNLDFRKVLHFADDICKLTPYINKISNHCVKTTASNVIYSRDFSKFLEKEIALADEISKVLHSDLFD